VTEKPITEPPKAFEYMGHTVTIEPEIVLVSGVETKAFSITIDGERLPVLYRNRTYATMDAGRIVWCEWAKATEEAA
jgi:hypothetical protein